MRRTMDPRVSSFAANRDRITVARALWPDDFPNRPRAVGVRVKVSLGVV
jgi:hypothetical protein